MEAAVARYACPTLWVVCEADYSLAQYLIDPLDLNLGTAFGSNTLCVGAVAGQDVTDLNSEPFAIVGGALFNKWRGGGAPF